MNVRASPGGRPIGVPDAGGNLGCSHGFIEAVLMVFGKEAGRRRRMGKWIVESVGHLSFPLACTHCNEAMR